MRFDLADLARRGRGGNRRPRSIILRPIVPTQAQAADLYARCYRPIITLLTARLPDLTAAYERSLPVRDGVSTALLTSAASTTEEPQKSATNGLSTKPSSTALADAATDDVQSVLSSIGEALNRLILTLAPGLELWAQSLEAWHRGRWRNAVLTATQVDIDTVLYASGQPTSLRETIAWNTSLIRDVSDQARARIGTSVFAAFQSRQPAAQLARTLRENVSMTRRRALLIASDQTSKLSAALDRERATDAGLEEYEWMHSGKLHPRTYHLSRNGKTFRYDDPPLHESRADPPGAAPGCGCRGRAKLTL